MTYSFLFALRRFCELIFSGINCFCSNTSELTALLEIPDIGAVFKCSPKNLISTTCYHMRGFMNILLFGAPQPLKGWTTLHWRVFANNFDFSKANADNLYTVGVRKPDLSGFWITGCIRISPRSF